MTTEKAYNQDFFNAIAGQFDEHVRQSIPYFDLFIKTLVENLARNFKHKYILDICGSTGELGRQLVESGYLGRYTCLDASPEMQKEFEKDNKSTQLSFELGAFGCDGWTENDGTVIPKFNPGNILWDVAVEILGFQFFTKDREEHIVEMARLSKVCIFFEKFSNQNWDQQELLKNEFWKKKFFTQEQIDKKQNEVLEDMGDYLYDSLEFELLLQENFENVFTIAHLGNFKGYICSNNIGVTWNPDDLNRLRSNNFTVKNS